MDSRPYIKDIVYVAPQPDWSFPLHSHESTAELSLVLRGRGTFYAANKEQLLSSGMLVVKNPKLSHSEKSDPDDPLEQICIEIEGVKTEGLPDNFIIPEYMVPVLSLGDEFDLLSDAFTYLMKNYKDPSRSLVCSKLLEVSLDLIKTHVLADTPPHDRKPKSKRELVSEIINYLDLHYREKIKISTLADLFYTSEGNLSRQFKAVTGYTVNEYIISKRMGEAQRMLIYEDEDIKDVALQCGYEDLQYFYRVFRSYAHCTPVEFREKYRTHDPKQ